MKKIISLIKRVVLHQDYRAPFSGDLKGKTILITGGSKGIGKAIAETLLTEGAKVILVSRSTINVKKEFKKYNINNIYSRIADVSIEDDVVSLVEDIININLKGTYLVCRSVLPMLKRQRRGTIINIGSKISHNTNVKANKVLYATSKYAIEGFSYALNKELKPYGVRSICLMPGTVNTFLSRDIEKYMSVYDVATVVMMVIKLENIDFEGIVFKSVKQNI